MIVKGGKWLQEAVVGENGGGFTAAMSRGVDSVACKRWWFSSQWVILLTRFLKAISLSNPRMISLEELTRR